MTIVQLPEIAQQGPIIEFPDTEEQLAQDEEWCIVKHGHKKETIRFHDYARLYRIPGLYEKLFYSRLRCDSPRQVVGLLGQMLERDDVQPDTLRGLDVGAGNGMVGEELQRLLGIESLVGVDIIPEAAQATERDRPGIYDDYVVADLTDLDDRQKNRIEAIRPNLLTLVAALGFGDIPAPAFARAWELLTTPAWVAFNIKDAFLDKRVDQSGFCQLIDRMIAAGVFDVKATLRYRHRFSLAGEPLHYVALIGTKTGRIPETWFLN